VIVVATVGVSTGVDVGINVGVRSVGVGGLVAVSVGGPGVLVGTSVYVTVDAGGSSRPWVAVGGKMDVSCDNGVGG
jgi:hypothetical protein